MIQLIENWIDQTLDFYSDEKKSCVCFSAPFKGYYPKDLLSRSYYVVADELPRIDLPELRREGLGGFIDMDFIGITYKNTYFIKKDYENDLALHFHELVHVVQWQYLGAKAFIARYIDELKTNGYAASPLEEMARTLENHFTLKNHFTNEEMVLDIPEYVKEKI
ncbi:MAG: hypothetical protein D3923_10185 [Candidatus Electrothrix sp. AR3]|nr:hypothetical protein [Candidatus Electrothrix sp. AR3]